MPQMTMRTADEEGFVTDGTLAYYMARALGGAGLITVEMAAPEKASRHRRRELGIYDDGFLPGLQRLVHAIHEGGAKASIQLGHGGGHTRKNIYGGTPVAPSAIPHPVFEITFETIVPEEMTKVRIDDCIAAFVAAARRAQQAGFDAVEIHAAHGYLISPFLAPFENRWTDGYGRSLANRALRPQGLKGRKGSGAGKGVSFRYNVDVAAAPELLQQFDRVVIATGARYHFGLGRWPERLLEPFAFWCGPAKR